MKTFLLLSAGSLAEGSDGGSDPAYGEDDNEADSVIGHEIHEMGLLSLWHYVIIMTFISLQ